MQRTLGISGVGFVPICKYCKYHTVNDDCKKYRDYVTGEPYRCEVCRSSKFNLCGVEGKYYEERPKRKFVLPIGFFLVMLLHCAALGAIFYTPPAVAVGIAIFILLELAALWILLNCAVEAEAKRDKGGVK